MHPNPAHCYYRHDTYLFVTDDAERVRFVLHIDKEYQHITWARWDGTVVLESAIAQLVNNPLISTPIAREDFFRTLAFYIKTYDGAIY